MVVKYGIVSVMSGIIVVPERRETKGDILNYSYSKGRALW